MYLFLYLCSCEVSIPYVAIFGKYLYVDNVDEIFIRICIFRIIRIFRIRMANPSDKTLGLVFVFFVDLGP